MKEKRYFYSNRILLAFGALLRLFYVYKTPIDVRQHDLGYITSLSDTLVNPGHLGYIEYMAKFGRLPDINPYALFSYYHPPLHHILCGIWVKAAYTLGCSEGQAYKVAQYWICFLSIMALWSVFRILKYLQKEEKKIFIPFLCIAFFPGLIYMAGSMNNDTLCFLLGLLCVECYLHWLMEKKKVFLYVSALCMGLGMCVKINVIVLAIPIGMSMLLEWKKDISYWKDYLLYGALSVPLALLWPVRNYLRFHSGFGIASATPEDYKYIGMASLWERIGIPKVWNIVYPFHSPKGSYSANAWLITFKTSLFTECWPDIQGFPLWICRICFILAVILGLALAVLSIYLPIRWFWKGEKSLSWFLFWGYIAVIVTFIAFVLKYPYTCSSDFRYIPMALIFGEMNFAIGDNSQDGLLLRMFKPATNIMMAIFAVFSLVGLLVLIKIT